MRSMAQPNGSVALLPPEILTMIFQYVHQGQLEAMASILHDEIGYVVGEVSEEARENFEAEIRELSLYVWREDTAFPYALASVCSFWEDVLSFTPEFWTSVLHFIDAKPTSIAKAARYLAWSRDLPISVFVTRRYGLFDTSTTTATLECFRIVSYMHTLMPHMHRCVNLHIDSMSSRAFPILPRFFPCETPLLKSLCLTSKQESVSYMTMEPRVHHVFDDVPLIWNDSVGFAFRPALKTLSIDGRNFLRAMLDTKPWISEQPNLKNLALSFYSPMEELKSCGHLKHVITCIGCLPLYLVLTHISTFRSLVDLKLEGITFGTTTSDIVLDLCDLTHLRSLTLVSIAPDSIQELFRVCTIGNEQLRRLSFVSCPQLDRVTIPHISLSLSISFMHDNTDLAKFLRPWQGRLVIIAECASVNDNLLEMLTSRDDTLPPNPQIVVPGANFACPNTSDLYLDIPDTSTFTIESLRKMVEARNFYVDYEDQRWREDTVWGPAIQSLSIVDNTEGDISLEDRQWFEARVVTFSWDKCPEV